MQYNKKEPQLEDCSKLQSIEADLSKNGQKCNFPGKKLEKLVFVCPKINLESDFSSLLLKISTCDTRQRAVWPQKGGLRDWKCHRVWSSTFRLTYVSRFLLLTLGFKVIAPESFFATENGCEVLSFRQFCELTDRASFPPSVRDSIAADAIFEMFKTPSQIPSSEPGV